MTDDITRARERRDLGMERSTAHAEAVTDGWGDLAFQTLQMYVNEVRYEPFLAEDFLKWSRGLSNFPQPPDGRAWGSIFSKARKDGLLEKLHHVGAKTSNMGPKPLWKFIREPGDEDFPDEGVTMAPDVLPEPEHAPPRTPPPPAPQPTAQETPAPRTQGSLF